jgi:2-polyprenyl-6-methoxyphenol hydroxylase-like FAD-dependent oxidoreductase
MRTARVLVVGGGISGLTAGAALGRCGMQVDLVEIRPKLGDLGGVGLSVMGNATKALATIDAAQACVDAGMPADTFTARTPSGKVVATPEWPPLGKPQWPGQIGIARSDFHHILMATAERAGAEVRCGVTIDSISQDDARVFVTFTDGRSDDYDLVVAADGIYSATRTKLIPDSTGPQHVGLAVWRAWAPRPEGITTSQLHFGGPHGVVGICPMNERDCYIYCIQKAGVGEWRDPATLHEQLRETLEDYGGLIPPLAAQLNDPAHVSYRPLEWLLLPAPWYRGRVLLIGDAAHSNPPNVAQGAAMGIEDAVVLADEMSKPGSVEEALARFMARRWGRAKLVVEVSCNIAKAEAEHVPGFDAGAERARASITLAEPY